MSVRDYKSLWGTSNDMIKLITGEMTPITRNFFSLTCKRIHELIKNMNYCNESNSLIKISSDTSDSIAFIFEKWFTMKITRSGTAAQKFLSNVNNDKCIVLYPCVHSAQNYDKLFKSLNIAKKRVRMFNGNIQLIQFAFVKYSTKFVDESVWISEQYFNTDYYRMVHKTVQKEVSVPKIITGTLLPLNNGFMMYVRGDTTQPIFIATLDDIVKRIDKFTGTSHDIIC